MAHLFFQAKKKYIDFDDIEQMKKRYIDLHDKDKRNVARQLLTNYEKLHKLKDKINYEDNFKAWLGNELRNLQINKIADEE